MQWPSPVLGEIFDLLSVGALVMSRRRKLIWINQTARMLTGLDPTQDTEQVCGQLKDQGFCSWDCVLEAAPENGRPIFSNEITPQLENRPHSIMKIVTLLRNDAGCVEGCMEVFQDLSAYQELIERLGAEGRKLKEILDNISLGIFSCDRKGHLTFFNAMAERITGHLRREVLGKTCSQIFSDGFCDALAASASPGQGDEKAALMPTAMDKSIPVQLRHMLLKNSSGKPTGSLTTFSDQSLIHQYKKMLAGRYNFHDMVSRHPSMQAVFETASAVADTRATVLIEGPTGTGKDLLAKVIHNASHRRDRPMVKVNCAALPEHLLESEMFGYVKGAFTGAQKDKPGRFQDADHGTLFLDEIGDMPLPLQAKLLRVLEDKEFYPLGGRRPIRVDVRIISATNRDLKQMVEGKQFREDLFYRLNVMRIELPSLAQRREDIPLLIEHILKKLRLTHADAATEVAEDALAVLLNYDYPGNIRELENILEHALILCREGVIRAEHLPTNFRKKSPDLAAAAAAPLSVNAKAHAVNPEKEQIVQALVKCNWHRQSAAQHLRMDRTTLWRKMKRYRITPP